MDIKDVSRIYDEVLAVYRNEANAPEFSKYVDEHDPQTARLTLAIRPQDREQFFQRGELLITTASTDEGIRQAIERFVQLVIRHAEKKSKQ